jgi:hypothetical protein
MRKGGRGKNAARVAGIAGRGNASDRGSIAYTFNNSSKKKKSHKATTAGRT